MPESVQIPCPGRDPVQGTLHGGGRSTAVVVVHGILGSATMTEIDDVSRTLSAEHDVLAIDSRGHGRDPGRFTWGREEWRQVDAAVRWLANGERRPVAAVGFSFGGFHCARAAGRGAPVSRLVLVGAPADLALLEPFPLGPDFWRHVPVMLRRRRRVTRFEPPPRLSRVAQDPGELAAIRVPTLVVHGGADWLVRHPHAERYATSIAGARLLVIPGGLHAEYMVVSHRKVLFDAIRSFLS